LEVGKELDTQNPSTGKKPAKYILAGLYKLQNYLTSPSKTVLNVITSISVYGYKQIGYG
jgi:hypothetical protein